MIRPVLVTNLTDAISPRARYECQLTTFTVGVYPSTSCFLGSVSILDTYIMR